METPRIASTRTRPVPSDRRRYPRRTIPGIRGTLRSPGDVEVLDISLTGLAAEVAGEVTAGEHCFLELRHERSVAMVEAEVKWSAARLVERDTDPPVMSASPAWLRGHRSRRQQRHLELHPSSNARLSAVRGRKQRLRILRAWSEIRAWVVVPGRWSRGVLLGDSCRFVLGATAPGEALPRSYVLHLALIS